jgi:glycine oxidase
VRTFDVAIIGGGVIGVSIAFELAAEKLRVVVLERRQPGEEASWAAAGMLSPSPDSPRDFPLVPFAKESLRLYPRFVAAVEEASGKSAAYVRHGTLEFFFSPGAVAECQTRLRELQSFGLGAESVSVGEARRWESSAPSSARAALWLPEEGTVEPRLLMDALLEAAQNRGTEVRANCAVTGLVRDAGRCTGVIAAGEKISAGTVVLCAGCFSNELAGQPSPPFVVPTRPVRGQMLALRPLPNSVNLRRVLRSESAYLIPRRDGRIVAGSTIEEAGFNKHVTPAGMQKILNAALEICPDLAGAEIVETWAGLRPGTPDDLPILGPADFAGLLIATGHYRNGILLAPATARVVCDWILGAKPAFDVSAFSPMRFHGSKSQALSAV